MPGTAAGGTGSGRRRWGWAALMAGAFLAGLLLVGVALIRAPGTERPARENPAGPPTGFGVNADAPVALPATACASYDALYRGLEDFECDLHIHIHLENNILFPRAVELERKMLKTSHAR